MKTVWTLPAKIEIEMGPAMRSLSERRRLFVLSYFQNGGNGSDAAKAAGYSDVAGGCRTRASELLRQPNVLMALKEVGDAEFAALGPKAIHRVKGLMDMAGHKDHWNATKFALGQAGYRDVREVNMTVTKSPQEMAEEIKRMAIEMGKDPRELLGQNAVDVEFEDVTPLVIDGEEF